MEFNCKQTPTLSLIIKCFTWSTFKTDFMYHQYLKKSIFHVHGSLILSCCSLRHSIKQSKIY